MERLAARGTRLLVTADCGITSVDEVAAARAAGLDVVVTDHHAPRADGRRPDAPIVHPALGGYPCPDLCAAGVAHKVAAALLGAAGRGRAGADRADDDLDLVALATVADCVPLRGENRRLVRAGLAALARTRRPGLRALLRVAQADPGELDARTVGFRLAPRLNAAGRLARADAALELLLTTDEARAGEIADELDRLNAERRLVEQRILWAAEAQVAELQQAQAAAGGGRRPPTSCGAMTGTPGSSGSSPRASPSAITARRSSSPSTATGGRARAAPSRPSTCWAAWTPAPGTSSATAGIARPRAARWRGPSSTRCAPRSRPTRQACSRPTTWCPSQRVDAVVAGDELGLELAEELGRLAPFGTANPDVALLVPAARLADPRPMGEGKHLRFTLEAGPARARGVAFSRTSLPEAPDGVLDAVVALERNAWQGTVEPRLVLRCATAPDPGPITVLDPGGDPERTPSPAPLAGAARGAAEDRPAPAPPPGREPDGAIPVEDRRGGGIAGLLGALVASGEPVLVVCADAALRARHLGRRVGGFALCSYDALAADPALARAHRHLVALDPPACAAHAELLAADLGAAVHLAWGPPEVAFALRVTERDHDLRAPLLALYRALRDAPGRPLATVLAAHGPAARATRLLAVLTEMGLVVVDPLTDAVSVPPAERTDLDRSPTFRASAARLAEARRRLAPPAPRPEPAGVTPDATPAPALAGA